MDAIRNLISLGILGAGSILEVTLTALACYTSRGVYNRLGHWYSLLRRRLEGFSGLHYEYWSDHGVITYEKYIIQPTAPVTHT